MSTSGTTTFTQTRDQLIYDAFQLLGIYGVGRSISAADMQFAVSMLNKMVKAWEIKGLHLFTKSEGILFLTPYVGQYVVPGAKCCDSSDYNITQLTNNQNQGDTTIVVNSITGLSNGDNIGIVTNDNNITWTTISNITSYTITLSSGLLYAANSSNYIYDYTNQIGKPLRILDARKRSGIDLGSTSTQLDIPITMIAYKDYYDLPIKTDNSWPNQMCYLPSNTTGTIYLFTRPTTGADRIHFTYERMIQDLSNPGDNFDFPIEWLEALTYNLAMRLGGAFGKGQKAAQEIQPMAQNMLEQILGWDNEIVNLQIQPDYYD